MPTAGISPESMDWFIRIARRCDVERCKECGEARRRDEELCPACITHADSESVERIYAEPAKSVKDWKRD